MVKVIHLAIFLPAIFSIVSDLARYIDVMSVGDKAKRHVHTCTDT